MPRVDSNKTGARQPQRVLPRQENTDGRISKRQQRRKRHHGDAEHQTSPRSSPGACESQPPPPPPPAEDRAELRAELRAPPPAEACSRWSGRTPAFPCRGPPDSCPDLLDGLSPNPEGGSPSCQGESDGGDDDDDDLSESERLPASHSGRVPPRLQLRPEVIEAEGPSPGAHGPRGRSRGGFDFPDFLPPPFNSWSLGQLAVLYHAEGRGPASRPGPLQGPLERYLERLLRLEWHQIQTCQGERRGSGVLSGRHRSTAAAAAAASSRLSSPKCILQCQRAFPLTFLSSLQASHAALLSGCACAPPCCVRHSARGKPRFRPAHVHARQSGPSPPTERGVAGGPLPLPRRCHSESRVNSCASQSRRSGSPAMTGSHLRRMQASGNIRGPVQGADAKPQCTAGDAGDAGAARDRRSPARGDASDRRTGGLRRRGGSEQRRGRLERRAASERRRSGSGCRGGAGLKEREIKPDAVAAIMDNLPASRKRPLGRPNKVKQVEFVA